MNKTRRAFQRAQVIGVVPPTKPEIAPWQDSDEFAYTVAILAWRDGLTANGIARSLGFEPNAANLMRVKRALRRAHLRYLRIEPLPEQALEDKLKLVVNNGKDGSEIRFYVVKDDWKTFDTEPIRSGLVYLKAAEIVSEIIRDAVHKDSGSEANDVVICNAGGRSVSEAVKAMLQNPPVLDESDAAEIRLRQRLLFVAGNCAYQTDNFQRSANFLSVSMAELYGARHLAFPYELDPEFVKEHQARVESSVLFVCGAGDCHSGLMAQHLAKRRLSIPSESVGDVALNLLDKDGRPLEPSDPKAREYFRKINPSLGIPTISYLARRSRVLLVLDSSNPLEKTRISTAILRRDYVTDVVLGARLARAIIDEWE